MISLEPWSISGYWVLTYPGFYLDWHCQTAIVYLQLPLVIGELILKCGVVIFWCLLLNFECAHSRVGCNADRPNVLLFRSYTIRIRHPVIQQVHSLCAHTKWVIGSDRRSPFFFCLSAGAILRFLLLKKKENEKNEQTSKHCALASFEHAKSCEIELGRVLYQTNNLQRVC